MKLIIGYIKRIFTSYLLYLSVLGIAGICVLGAYTEGNPSVVMSLNNTLYFNSYRNLIIFLSALPFSSFYCMEWNNRTTYYIINRTSSAESIIAYVIVQAFTAFFVTFTGMFISIGILNILLPNFSDLTYVYNGTFTQFINEKQSFLYLFIIIFHYSISVSAWSISGLMVSSIFMNPYIAICSPLVISYTFEIFTIGTSKYTDLWTLSLSYSTISESPLISSVYICGVFISLGAVFATAFYFIAGRRIRCEIT